jgi:hypothetical protein
MTPLSKISTAPAAFKRLPSGSCGVLEHLQAVVIVSVNHARRGNSVRVFGVRIELDAIIFGGQVFTQNVGAPVVRREADRSVADPAAARVRYWIGHAEKSVTDRYSKLKDDLEFRKQVCAKVGLGFALPPKIRS